MEGWREGKEENIFPSFLDEEVHYSISRFKSGHYLWFFTSLFVFQLGVLGGVCCFSYPLRISWFLFSFHSCSFPAVTVGNEKSMCECLTIGSEGYIYALMDPG